MRGINLLKYFRGVTMKKRVYGLFANGSFLGGFWSVADAVWAAKEIYRLTTWTVESTHLYGEAS